MGSNYPLKVGINSINVVSSYPTNPVQGFETVNTTRSQLDAKVRLRHVELAQCRAKASGEVRR